MKSLNSPRRSSTRVRFMKVYRGHHDSAIIVLPPIGNPLWWGERSYFAVLREDPAIDSQCIMDCIHNQCILGPFIGNCEMQMFCSCFRAGDTNTNVFVDAIIESSPLRLVSVNQEAYRSLYSKKSKKAKEISKFLRRLFDSILGDDPKELMPHQSRMTCPILFSALASYYYEMSHNTD